MNVMALSCIKATQIMEMREYMPIGMIRAMQLRMHVSMCSGCRNYMKQTMLISKLLERNFSEFSAINDADGLEARIISKL